MHGNERGQEEPVMDAGANEGLQREEEMMTTVGRRRTRQKTWRTTKGTGERERESLDLDRLRGSCLTRRQRGGKVIRGRCIHSDGLS